VRGARILVILLGELPPLSPWSPWRSRWRRAPEPKGAPSSDDADADQALIVAAGAGDAATVSRLLADDADLRAIDSSSATALVRAAYGNHVDVAHALIAAGADVTAQDRTRQSSYLIATSEGYLDLLELTLASGADVEGKDSCNGTGLIRAADRGHADVVRRLIRAGIEIDHVNRLGWTALHEAIILGDGSDRSLQTVRSLVDAGRTSTVRPRRNPPAGVRPAAEATTGSRSCCRRPAPPDESPGRGEPMQRTLFEP
jgi:ankyrin repeat protein